MSGDEDHLRRVPARCVASEPRRPGRRRPPSAVDRRGVPHPGRDARPPAPGDGAAASLTPMHSTGSTASCSERAKVGPQKGEARSLCRACRRPRCTRWTSPSPPARSMRSARLLSATSTLTDHPSRPNRAGDLERGGDSDLLGLGEGRQAAGALPPRAGDGNSTWRAVRARW